MSVAGLYPTSAPRLNGPDMLAGADALRRQRGKGEQWPYDWVYAPPGSERRNPSASITSPGGPAVGVEILAYQVPSGHRFALHGVVISYQGGNFVIGSGDILFTVDRDSPPGGGFTSSPLADLANVTIPLGSISPWAPLWFSRAEVFEPLQVLRAKVTLTNAIPAGIPNFFSAMFLGYEWPVR